MFQRLIALPSVSSLDARHDQSNAAVIAELAEWLELLGFSIQTQTVASSPEKLNLIAHRGDDSGEGLVLAGHTDTVPYDEQGWQSDPFQLTERDERYYGLGCTDMKSFFPIVIEALRTLDPDTLQKPLTIIATADEESSMAGVKRIVATGKRLGRYALIGEPTNLTPINMHKGILIEAIRLLGASGHASNPALGNNAIDGMRRVLDALSRWRDELAVEHRDAAFAVPEPTLNFGNIHGGDSPNRICARCELQVDIRVLPSMDFDKVRAALRQKVDSAIAGLQLGLEIDSLGSGGVPPLLTAADSRLVRALERLSGQAAQSVGFATEGPFLNSVGMETVIFGPGDIAQAHQPNEYLAQARIQPAIEIVRDLILEFCAVSHDRR
jgi:acetylornithine deacetylase